MNILSLTKHTQSRLTRGTLLALSLFGFAYGADVTISVDRVDGEIVYNMKGSDTGCVSRLVFPYEIDSVGVGAKFELPRQYLLQIQAVAPIRKFNSTGEDFDWINGEPTIYSSSTSEVSTYRALNITLSKPYTQNVDYFFRTEYSYLNTIWHGTNQINFISDTMQSAEQKTIDFEHTGYTFATGFDLKYDVGYGIMAIASPYVGVGYSEVSTVYQMRDVNFSQKAFPLSIGIAINLEKVLGKSSAIGTQLEGRVAKDIRGDAKLSVDGEDFDPATDYKHSLYRLGLYYKYLF